MAEEVGRARCSECSTEQTVKYDGRKYYIACAHEPCRMTSVYQCMQAQKRLLARMVPLDALPTTPPQKPEAQPVKTGLFGFVSECLESYAEWYGLDDSKEKK